MRKVLAFAALGLVLSVTAASAQGGGGGRRGGGQFGGRGGGGGLQLLGIKEVQTELKMTEPQVAKLQEVQQKQREERQNSGFDFQNATPEERQAFMKKMQDSQTKAVGEILDSKQAKRLHQIELQQPGALNRPEVQAELKITDDQKQKIQEVQRAAMEEMRAAFTGGNPQDMTPEERQAMMKKVQDGQKAANEKVMAVLTDAQKKQLKEMQGEPFKMPAFGPGGPGGARRPGGAGGNPPPPPAA